MDLRFTPDENAFRETVQRFFAAEIPAEIRRKVREGRRLSKQELVTSHQILNKQGWAVAHWPREWGGQDWSPIERSIYVEELLQASVPLPLQFNVYMVGPVIAAFGSPEQKSRFLPATANLDIWWCQGFSEPGAGSDLASLKTTARREGDFYIVNGQKTWTTLAQYADWIFALVRTDPQAAKKQSGISFLLIDMQTPGVTVRPIQTIDGGYEVNEVFFDEVRVPVENRVGEENRGWDYAKFLLGNERSGIARIGLSKARIRRIKELAARIPSADGMLWDQQSFRSKVRLVEIELKALEMTQLRVVAAERADTLHNPGPNPASSILKIKGTELQQATTELLLEMAGPYAMIDRDGKDEGLEGHNDLPDEFEWADAAAPTYFNQRKVSIYGGSNEIQRNIIAKSILGL